MIPGDEGRVATLMCGPGDLGETSTSARPSLREWGPLGEVSSWSVSEVWPWR